MLDFLIYWVGLTVVMVGSAVACLTLCIAIPYMLMTWSWRRGGVVKDFVSWHVKHRQRPNRK